MTVAVPACRACGAPLTRTLVDLGMQPLANSYVPLHKGDVADPVYTLHTRVCDACLLVQADEVVPAEDIFTDYAYFSSFSDSWLAHSKAYAEVATRRFGLNHASLVIEIASNDGYLLQYFLELGVPVLGVEPAANVAETAIAKGVRTWVAFFGDDLAKTLLSEGFKPDLITSANVLAHVPDINDFVAGVSTLLSGEAVYSVEFPHLLNLIEKVQFDTIYHEHYSYLSLLAVDKLFARNGMRTFDVEELPTHGGSLRVYGCKVEAGRPRTPAVDQVLGKEIAAGLDGPSGYAGFEPRVQKVRTDLLAFLTAAKAEGKTVAAYGAAAKGNTILNYCGVGTDLVAYCVDRNPAKMNTLLPGSHIPVLSVETLRERTPDYVLILPWNLRTEITGQLADLKAKGVKFVTAIPDIQIT